MGKKVEFKRSNITVDWDDRFESILELAEESGISIESDCEQGFCGTCKVKLLDGEVTMETDDGLDDEDLEQKMILLCVAIPKTDIVVIEA
jgi:ferredoxin